jgi:anaphase-promoting complex subunit 4
MIGVPQTPTPVTDKWLPDGHDRSFYDTFKALLSQQKQVQLEGGDGTTVDAPKLNDLTRRLGIQFNKVFAEIALTQRRGILHRSPITLHQDCDRDVLDMKVCYEVSYCLMIIRSPPLSRTMADCFSKDMVKGDPCSIYVAARSASTKSLGL